MLAYKETDNYILFHGSFLSQWYKREIVVDSIKYSCCEQLMMSEKARLFGDEDALKKIMQSDDPSVQKSFGRKVKNFNKKEWDTVARHIVFKANYAKFSQHEDLKNKLLETGDKIIVEASPYDTIWGIGLGCNDDRVLDPNQWRGTNWLGEEIMKVREFLKNGL